MSADDQQFLDVVSFLQKHAFFLAIKKKRPLTLIRARAS